MVKNHVKYTKSAKSLHTTATVTPDLSNKPRTSKRSLRLIKVGVFTFLHSILLLIQIFNAPTNAAPASTNSISINATLTSTTTSSDHHHNPILDEFKGLDEAGIRRRIFSAFFDKYFENCTLPALFEFPRDFFTREQRQHGAILVHLVVSVYLFYALLLICDDYFVPSVESICRELKMPSDVAGATFMAASTSAPELFTNFIGTFVTKGTMGLGTIVGSAVFNILAVATICGIGAGWAVEKIKAPDGRVGIPLEWWPLTRDSVFYVLSVGALIAALYDLRIVWYEALALIALYGLYIVVLVYNAKLKQCTEWFLRSVRKYCCAASEAKKRRHRISRVVPPTPKSPKPTIKHFENTPLLFAQNEHGVTRPAKIDGEPKSNGRTGFGADSGSDSDISLSSNDFDELLISKALLRSASHCVDEKEDPGLCGCPESGSGFLKWLGWIVSWPIRCCLTLTIPDCRKYSWRKWYAITLLMCVIWIGGLTYLLSWMMTVISDTVGIPDSVTGLTLLAAGTSIPEIFSSVIVARQGLGAMALSNSVGSNTFDILICLGLPWLLQLTVLGLNGEVGEIAINSGGLEWSSLMMIVILVILYTVLAWNGFWLDRTIGVLSLVMYVLFIALAIMLEMNVFFPVNLPVCRLDL